MVNLFKVRAIAIDRKCQYTYNFLIVIFSDHITLYDFNFKAIYKYYAVCTLSNIYRQIKSAVKKYLFSINYKLTDIKIESLSKNIIDINGLSNIESYIQRVYSYELKFEINGEHNLEAVVVFSKSNNSLTPKSVTISSITGFPNLRLCHILHNQNDYVITDQDTYYNKNLESICEGLIYYTINELLIDDKIDSFKSLKLISDIGEPDISLSFPTEIKHEYTIRFDSRKLFRSELKNIQSDPKYANLFIYPIESTCEIKVFSKKTN